MPYLIDGHNLIHYLDDIHLDDPHDEAKLVIKLRGFCARRSKKVIVVFDHGLPGGYSQLSTPSVMVVFASAVHTNADNIIRERINNIRDIKGWTVVSTDNEVLDSARTAGMRGMKCVDFAEILTRKLDEKPHEGENPNVMVSPDEVQEWLTLFGVDADETFLDEIAPEISTTSKAIVSKPSIIKSKKAPASKRDLSKIKNADDEVEQWLDIFGENPQREVTDKPQPFIIHGKKEPKQDDNTTDEVNEEVKGGSLSISDNSVDAWLDIFGEPEPDREPTDPAYQRNDPSKQGRYKNSQGKREPSVYKGMATSDEVYLNEGEVDAWMDVFGASDED
ncbi:MAG: hypothetical protein Phog2KO_47180 [Phototrophicaceae bacterium]